MQIFVKFVLSKILIKLMITATVALWEYPFNCSLSKAHPGSNLLLNHLLISHSCQTLHYLSKGEVQ